MADTLAFGEIRFAAPQSLFHTFALGNVLEQSHEVIGRAVGTPQESLGYNAFDDLAILSNPPLVQPVAIGFASHDAIKLCYFAGKIVRMGQLRPCLLQQFAPLV